VNVHVKGLLDVANAALHPHVEIIFRDREDRKSVRREEILDGLHFLVCGRERGVKNRPA